MRNARLLLPLIVLLCACKGSQPVVITTAPVVLAQYTFETTPNSLDKVGFVFAVDRNGVQIPLTNLTTGIQPDGTVTVPSSSSSKDVTFGALLKFLGLEKVNASGELNINNNKKVQTVFSLDAPKLSRGLLVDMDQEFESKKPIIKQTLVNRHLEDAKVYAIIEVIKSKKMTYDFSKANIGQASLDANLNEIATTLGPKVQWNGANSKSLSFELDGEQCVFYKLIPYEIISNLSGGIDLKKGQEIDGGELIYSKKAE